MPLETGRYLTVNGGTTQTLNGHIHVLADGEPAEAGQAFAADLVGITAMGLRSDGWEPADPARYQAFGKKILAPCTGTVTDVRDGRPDMPVPKTDPDDPSGNTVAMLCDDVTIVMAHFRQGSILVRSGQGVVTGEALGQVGNSGNTSEPHLHIHAQLDGDGSGNPTPIALTFNGRLPFRNTRFVVDGAE